MLGVRPEHAELGRRRAGQLAARGRGGRDARRRAARLRQARRIAVHRAHRRHAAAAAARRHRAAARGRRAHCTGSTRKARRVSAHLSRNERIDAAVALSALDRAPRRRQAGAREHAGGVSRRRKPRLSRVRMRRQAERRRRAVPAARRDAAAHDRRDAASPSELRWAELSRLDAGGWHGRAYAGEPLPSLQAVARYVQRNGYALNIEIKPTPGAGARDRARRRAARRRACGRGIRTPPLLSSFQPDALAGAAKRRPSCRAACCSIVCPTAGSTWRSALGCVAVVSLYALMDAALIERLHGAGLRALAYTVNDPAEAHRLAALGIDGLDHRRGRSLLAGWPRARLTTAQLR